MTRKFFRSFENLSTSLSEKKEIYGILGLTLNGSKTVEVPNRSAFVYVRLRDNQSEVIQAFNEKVSPVYGLPVRIERKGNHYEVIGRDTERYTDWQGYSAFLPRHGDQHSFNDSGGGGDVAWIYGRQMMPMLTTPSGSFGGSNVLISPYVLRDLTGNWKYVGDTGTVNLLQYKPTNNQAIMGMIYVDSVSGNPYVLINSGTSFSASLTGTAQILPYVPAIPGNNPNYLPDSFIRLVSGTTIIGWDNIYDARQFIRVAPTGTSSGLFSIAVQDEGIAQGDATVFNFVGTGVTTSISGTSARVNIPTPSGVYKNPGSVLFAGADGFPDENSARFYWDRKNNRLRIGPTGSMSIPYGQLTITGPSVDNPPAFNLWAYGAFGSDNGPAPSIFGYRMRGDLNAPQPVQNNDAILSLNGAGYDGGNFWTSSRIRSLANGDWSSGTHIGSRWEFEVTPSGTLSRQVRMSVDGYNVNIPDGTYNISGSPHSHSGLVTNGDSHDHSGGDGGQIAYSSLSGAPQAETNANYLFRCDNPGGVSAFAGTIATLPGGATLTYNVTSGQEGAMVPAATTQLAKLRLYNTTRGTSALILNCVTGTNTLTLTANVPAGWQVGDTVTIASQTVNGGGYSWVDLEITSGPINKASLFVVFFIKSANVGDAMRTHPIESFAGSKATFLAELVSNQYTAGFGLIKITSNAFAFAWNGSPTELYIQESGYLS